LEHDSIGSFTDSEQNSVSNSSIAAIPDENLMDPLEQFGFGVFSYFSLTQTLVFLFLLFTICWLPAMFLYSKFHDESWPYYSIADLGETTTKCKIMNAATGPFLIDCKSGEISSIISAGSFSNDSEAFDKGVCSS